MIFSAILSNALIKKVWEPLFSKSSGKKKRVGTGLGLTIVRAITNDMEGYAEIKGKSKLYTPLWDNFFVLIILAAKGSRVDN